MKTRHIFIPIVALCLTAATPMAQAQNKKVSPPMTLEHEGKTLRYNPAWQDKETYLETNIDDDPEPEIIISFAASYKPPAQEEAREDFKPFVVKKREIPIIENYTFFQIFDLGSGGRYKLTRTLSGMDRIGTVTIIRPDPNALPVIVFVSPGGETYADVSAYRWQNNGLKRLLSEGGDAGSILIESQATPPALQIENRRYLWNNTQNAFLLQNAAQEKSGKPLTDAL